jgi:uncharacterized membrane protein
MTRYLPVSLDSLKSIGDNVFGFSMTLLAVQLVVPVGSDAAILQGLGVQWPAFFAYVTTFALLGTLWYAFHVDLRYVRVVDRNLVLINLPLLFIATLQPFAALLFGRNLGTSVGVMVPAASALAFFLLLWARWAYISGPRGLLVSSVERKTVRGTHRALASLVLLSAVAIVVAFIQPWLSLGIFFLGGLAFYVTPLGRRVWPDAVAAQPAEEVV